MRPFCQSRSLIWARHSSPGRAPDCDRLLHFRVPNHGKLWKSLMRAHLGDYEAMERQLKRVVQNQSALRTAFGRR
jgi:hypothetical protein